MAHFNIEKISLSCKDREKEEKNRVQRRRTILILMYRYLKEYGYIQAANALVSEINFNIMEYCICDNIHMESIIEDYESYYFLKYQRRPQIVKKICEDMIVKNVSDKATSNRFLRASKLPSQVKIKTSVDNKDQETNGLKSASKSNVNSYNITEETDEHILQPLGSFENYSKEWRCMAEIILQDMQTVNKKVLWNDIVGHDRPKELLREAIVYPLKYKELYCSISPWRSMLLYGPSGTGKTLLASAVASESGANFFKICISTLISKWRGESEKLMKVLFDLAKHYAPSIIFIDEIDAILSHRGEDHEASRRMKTELFMQLDSLFSSDKLVLVLSATNMPWQLDYALLRRLEKRILISHPDKKCRKELFEKFLPRLMNISNSEIQMDLDYQKLAKVTENYSASDIETVCKEVKLSYLRQVINAFKSRSTASRPVSSAFIHAVNTSDVLKIVDKVKPTASELLLRYEEWQQKHGSE